MAALTQGGVVPERALRSEGQMLEKLLAIVLPPLAQAIISLIQGKSEVEATMILIEHLQDELAKREYPNYHPSSSRDPSKEGNSGES